MDWDNIRVFLHVARTGRVIDAAKALALDHSTISRRLAKLEESLGVQLFERAGRRLRITSAGEDLRRSAAKLESIVLQEIGGLGAETTKGMTGRVRIGAPEGLGVGYLGGRIAAIMQDYPNLDIELVALPQTYSLSSREADIAISLDRPEEGSLATRKLTDYELGFYATGDYLGRNGVPQTLDDLTGHTLCGYIAGLLHTRELAYLDIADLKPAMRFTSTSIIAQCAMIESGMAMGVLPAYLAAGKHLLVPVLQRSFLLRRSYWLSVHEDLRRHARIRKTVDLLTAAVRRERSLFDKGSSTRDTSAS
ncbi:LysR family transcriptional regulator [Rhizobium laguerreae]|uniref:LysR family transcriptional regulator n=1 Tax=Rhizobium laguerreae TaxID=1076926 RepID=UPI001A8CE22D|nr:LysR family transcriptional regulator [Rhizobium laguerreae]MBN9982705.1 LysR family transcriptional regulator [Rhizobium laguerreae]